MMAAVSPEEGRRGLDRPWTRRQEALLLADELLSDIELSRIKAIDTARKASRLARLLDDSDAMQWLWYEIRGYPASLDALATEAAIRSARQTQGDNGEERYWIQTLGEIESQAETSAAEVAGLASSPTSGSPSAATVEQQKRERLTLLRQFGSQQQGLLDKIVGSIHAYVAQRYQELRFGASVESAFEVLRSEVDGAIAEIVPRGLHMLTAAFENAASENPEHWAGAASTCRRLLKAAADTLSPVGDPITRADGVKVRMGREQYVNRLVAWVEKQAGSETAAELVVADLTSLGNRLDAVKQAGLKGAHAPLSRVEASRFIIGTYVLLADLLILRAD